MELNKASEAAVTEEIDKRFGDKVYKRFDREKDADVYTGWNDFFQQLEQCKPSLQKKYVFYWAKKAFQHFRIANFPLFPLLCVTGGSAEIPEGRYCFFAYIADYLLSEKENALVSRLAMQYVSENCSDNTGRFGTMINEFRDIIRHKYAHQQRKKRMMSKFLTVTFGVFCGMTAGFVIGMFLGIHINQTPSVSVQESMTESLTEPTEGETSVSTRSDASMVSADNGKVSESSVTETTSPVSQRPDVSKVSSDTGKASAESSTTPKTSSESSVTETTSPVSQRPDVSMVSSDTGKASDESSTTPKTSLESSVTETTSPVSQRPTLSDIFSLEGKAMVIIR